MYSSATGASPITPNTSSPLVPSAIIQSSFWVTVPPRSLTTSAISSLSHSPTKKSRRYVRL